MECDPGGGKNGEYDRTSDRAGCASRKPCRTGEGCIEQMPLGRLSRDWPRIKECNRPIEGGMETDHEPKAARAKDGEYR